MSHNAVNTETVAYHKNAQDWEEPRKIGLNINNPEIKDTASINKYPDGEKGLDSANIYWLKKALNRMLKVVLDTAKSSHESSPPYNR